ASTKTSSASPILEGIFMIDPSVSRSCPFTGMPAGPTCCLQDSTSARDVSCELLYPSVVDKKAFTNDFTYQLPF
ncbi:MAG TPA: hypothetical protein VE242_03225, partial [Chthoniobacterales bacterium]|nr:hypothetical protein [Chthoniobacterales bacterium]